MYLYRRVRILRFLPLWPMILERRGREVGRHSLGHPSPDTVTTVVSAAAEKSRFVKKEEDGGVQIRARMPAALNGDEDVPIVG